MATVKGIWVGKDGTEIWSSTSVSITQEVNFVSDGQSFDSMYVDYNSMMGLVRCIDYRSSTNGTVTAFNGSDEWFPGDVEDQYRIVDFGTTEQEVSDTYYTWFTASFEQQTSEEEETTTAITFDLSTLNLSAGTYSITVKARSDGYADSAESSAVSYTVGVNLITFTVDGMTFQAEEGMTWEEWCESEYNTDNFYVDLYDDSVIRGAAWITIGSGGRVYGSNSIEENGVYKSQHGGDSN